MKLPTGWYRLCVFSSVMWTTGVLSFALYELWFKAAGCRAIGIYDSAGSMNIKCAVTLWAWSGDGSDTGVLMSENPLLLLVPEFFALFCLLIVVPAAFFALAHGAAWVREGFKDKA